MLFNYFLPFPNNLPYLSHTITSFPQIFLKYSSYIQLSKQQKTPHTVSYEEVEVKLTRKNYISTKLKSLHFNSLLALINELSKNSEIYGIERIKELADKSSKVLNDNKNIKIINDNGIRGLKSKAPFDRILISASADKILEHLYFQLNDDGIMVCVVKNSIFQIRKINGKIKKKEYPGFVFVPLVDV